MLAFKPFFYRRYRRSPHCVAFTVSSCSISPNRHTGLFFTLDICIFQLSALVGRGAPKTVTLTL